MVIIIFEVDKSAIAYIMQLRGIEAFTVSRYAWNRHLKGTYDPSGLADIKNIESRVEKESDEAEHLKDFIERKWRLHEQTILTWLKEITQVDFKAPVVRVCVVPLGACQAPSKDLPQSCLVEFAEDGIIPRA
jgi:hypothetical protein